MSKFKYGDRVIAGGHSGKIKSIKKENGRFFCTVIFDNSSLIPSELEYEEKYIKFENKYEDFCPACGKKWKVVKFNMKTWKDCVKCNKTQEQLVKEDYENKKNTPPPVPESYEDLLIEFEKMLDNKIDEEDDDFDPHNDFFDYFDYFDYIDF